MKNFNESSSDDTNQKIVDGIYQIALEPDVIEDFIDFWAEGEISKTHGTDAKGDGASFDRHFKSHLERAEAFLSRETTSSLDFEQFLRPYENLAAFLIDSALNVITANDGATSTFGVQAGKPLLDPSDSGSLNSELAEAANLVLFDEKRSEHLVKVDAGPKQGAILFRVNRISDAGINGPVALIVSTQFHWAEPTNALLSGSFNLTTAEQNVTRLLAEGKDTQAIADYRDSSIGTVRAQIKSIIRKLNLRSQSDVVRFAMTLASFRRTDADDTRQPVTVPTQLSGVDMEAEAWKPFKSFNLPDGRTLTYHDMGLPTGNPVLISHMGSCMLRWTPDMLRMAFRKNLRVICPIRAGYGNSDHHSDAQTNDRNVLEATSADVTHLLDHLGITRLPYAVMGTDFPLAAHMVASRPDRISALIGIGGRPCLPGGMEIEGAGRWQKFFVWTAKHNPKLTQYSANAVMAMSRRIGAEAMLQRLCKDSPADLAILNDPQAKKVLEANIGYMSGKTTNAGQAFAKEYIAFQDDWSAHVLATKDIPVEIFIANEDPTVNPAEVSKLQEAYPWMEFEILQDTGLALMYQKPELLIGKMADYALQARQVPPK